MDFLVLYYNIETTQVKNPIKINGLWRKVAYKTRIIVLIQYVAMHFGPDKSVLASSGHFGILPL